MVITCCKDCKHRHKYCHTYCVIYKEQREQLDEENRKTRENLKQDAVGVLCASKSRKKERWIRSNKH